MLTETDVMVAFESKMVPAQIFFAAATQFEFAFVRSGTTCA